MSRGGEQIKVSQVAGLIDQIETGGGESDTFTKILSFKVNGSDLKDLDELRTGTNIEIIVDKNIYYTSYLYFLYSKNNSISSLNLYKMELSGENLTTLTGTIPDDFPVSWNASIGYYCCLILVLDDDHCDNPSLVWQKYAQGE